MVRTEQEAKEFYGADAAEWLARWDAGDTVWTIEMGGLGPGYEQALQIAAAEIIRFMLAQAYNASAWEDKDFWKKTREEIEQWSFADGPIKELGLSGAQWGAAMNIAVNFYRDGPVKALTDDNLKDRHIQVSKTFPKAA
jgi:hypothetical protein